MAMKSTGRYSQRLTCDPLAVTKHQTSAAVTVVQINVAPVLSLAWILCVSRFWMRATDLYSPVSVLPVRAASATPRMRAEREKSQTG